MLCRRNHDSSKERRGFAAAELAIAVSTFVFIMVASTDFARLFFASLTIASCARNGALYGCQSTTNANNTTAIKNAALADAGSLSITAANVTPTTGTDSSISGDSFTYVAVTVRYTFNTLLTYPGITSSMSLSNTVRMRVVQSQPD